jgi:hypothetical protein
MKTIDFLGFEITKTNNSFFSPYNPLFSSASIYTPCKALIIGLYFTQRTIGLIIF